MSLSIAYKEKIETSKRKIEEEMCYILATNMELEREARVGKNAEEQLRENKKKLEQLMGEYMRRCKHEI